MPRYPSFPQADISALSGCDYPDNVPYLAQVHDHPRERGIRWRQSALSSVILPETYSLRFRCTAALGFPFFMRLHRRFDQLLSRSSAQFFASASSVQRQHVFPSLPPHSAFPVWLLLPRAPTVPFCFRCCRIFLLCFRFATDSAAVSVWRFPQAVAFFSAQSRRISCRNVVF